MTRIIHVAATSLTLDTFVRKVSSSLEARGYKFSYLSDLGSESEQNVGDGPKFRLRRGMFFFLSWFGNWRAFQGLLAGGPAIVHVHTPATALAMLPYLLLMRRRKIKLVYTARGGFYEGVALPIRMVWALIDPLSWKVWNSVGVINEFLLSRALALHPSVNVHLLSHGGASPNVCAHGLRDSTSKRSSNRMGDKIVLGWVGRFARDKRPGDFLQLLQVLREDYSLKVEGIVLGEQSKHDRGFTARSTPGVSFEGWVACPQHQLRNCDLLISTSVREGYGMAVLEAGLVGTPTIARRTLGTAKSVLDSHGYLIESGSVRALADRVNAWATLSWQERASLREAVRNKSAESLDKGNLADELHAMYEGLWV